jgi:hypothetical protein
VALVVTTIITSIIAVIVAVIISMIPITVATVRSLIAVVVSIRSTVFGYRSGGHCSGHHCFRSWSSLALEVRLGHVLVARTPSWFAWRRGGTDTGHP